MSGNGIAVCKCELVDSGSLADPNHVCSHARCGNLVNVWCQLCVREVDRVRAVHASERRTLHNLAHHADTKLEPTQKAGAA